MDNRVREVRLTAGMTQEDLAAHVEVFRQTIHAVETGRYQPSLLLAFKLSITLGIPVEDLFWLTESEETWLARKPQVTSAQIPRVRHRKS